MKFKPWEVSDRTAALLVFFLALSVRFVYLVQLQPLSLTAHLSLDAASYDNWAMEIARGDWLGKQVFYQAPLYPYFLALLYKVFGHHLNLVRSVQLCMGAFNCVILFWTARRLFGRREALWCGAMAILYGLLVFYEGAIGKDGLSILLTDLALLALVRALDEPRWTRWLLSGITLGLAILTRGNLILLIPLVIAWMVFVPNRHALGTRLVAATALAAGTALVIAPVTVRNYIVGQDLVLETSQGGQNFYIGNNPKANGFFENPERIRLNPEYEEEDFKAEALRRTGKTDMKPSEISSFWFGEGIRFIKANPQRTLWLLAKKTAMFWNRFEIPDNYNYYFFRQETPILRFLFLGFGVIAPLGLWGLFLARQKPVTWLFAIFVFGYMVSIVPFHIASRYRLPIVPPLIVFAAYALTRATDRVRAEGMKSLVAPLIPVALVALLVNWRVIDEAGTFKAPYTEMGIAASEQGDWEEAVAHFQKALDLDPRYAPAHYNLGNVFAKQGRYVEALRAFEKTLQADPEFLLAYDNLAKTYLRLGAWQQALESLDKALALRPDFAEALVTKGAVYHSMGLFDQAVEHYEEAITEKPRLASAYYNLACAYGRKGAVEAARSALEKAVALRPEYREKALADEDLAILK